MNSRIEWGEGDFNWRTDINRFLERGIDDGAILNPERKMYQWSGDDTKMSWAIRIALSIKSLGGEADYPDIYDEIESNPHRNLTQQWKATVRQRIESHSSDSELFQGNLDIFYAAAGIGEGRWGLRSTKEDFILNKLDNLNSEMEKYVKKTIQNPNYVLKIIAVRRGQPAFRAKLLDLYGSCMITDCADLQVLEACHIIPYSVSNDNSVENGLLLRADIHTLFDLKLITIDNHLKIKVSSKLKDKSYRKWHGLKIKPAPQVDEDKFKTNLTE
ncbi:HNH endonuclease [Euryarchaeota archaeon]|nr:HNH endonuclease [Euryarchaeota archaeon]